MNHRACDPATVPSGVSARVFDPAAPGVGAVRPNAVARAFARRCVDGGAVDHGVPCGGACRVAEEESPLAEPGPRPPLVAEAGERCARGAVRRRGDRLAAYFSPGSRLLLPEAGGKGGKALKKEVDSR